MKPEVSNISFDYDKFISMDSELSDRKNVLFVVDLQKEFRDSDGQYERILNWVREQITNNTYDLVLATKCHNSENSVFKYTGWTDMLDSEPAELEFVPDLVIDKYSYGVPFIKGLQSSWHYDIIGFNTGACVLKTALDLGDMGFSISVLSDYCYSSDGKEKHERGLWTLKNLLGTAVK